MKYEETPIKKTSNKKLKEYDIGRLDTSAILWLLVRRHKFSLVSGYAITLTVVYLFPPLPDMVLSLMGR